MPVTHAHTPAALGQGLKNRVALGLLSLALALPCTVFAQLTGVVVGVPDGDTLVVRIEQHVVKIHLTHVDAPEMGQPFGADARESLVQLCDTKVMSVDDLGIDSDRHIFGDVECAGVDAAEAQVRRGLAWTLQSKSPQAPAQAVQTLQTLQGEARADHRGLWADASPVPPWEWSAIFTQ